MSDAQSDRELWRGFRRMYETTAMAVERELQAAVGLSAADHGILSRLCAAGRLRQQELAERMRWDRTRLSHHLTRMEARGLVERRRSDGGTLVAATPAGERARSEADPAHAEAIRRHFLDRLSSEQRAGLDALVQTFDGD